MYLIGLTGGIASGKSTVARRLVQHGAVLVDADVLARKAVEPGTPALAAIRETFGDQVLRADGSLDREKLGAVIFHDDAARDKLNAIVHPAVRELGEKMKAEAVAADPDVVIVHDIPLLVEAGRAGEGFDKIVVVEAPKKTRVARLVEERGLDPAHAVARVEAQASDEERRAVADVVIDADGTLAHTMSQVDDLWLQIQAERGVGGRP
ncbi:dephospho-CoA kinase [Microterricola viridarii]|uniref:Dephospho-CoA kinase n=1 Tax=Microterricola viridarii TaxID=412690 RepID=A0A1H1U8B7_9MICO|nr:dephospho-CoA kinase [Microterricola viridarii]SDS68714.1 dephospho-CoA kinase [Microterricola viridarii]